LPDRLACLTGSLAKYVILHNEGSRDKTIAAVFVTNIYLLHKKKCPAVCEMCAEARAVLKLEEV
jgi:hypothetical protein